MRRRTTPTHIFTVDVDLTAAVEIYLTYCQNKMILVEKGINDIAVTDTTLTVKMTQDETSRFSESGFVEVQLAYKMPDGFVDRSKIIRIAVDRILKDEDL